MDLGRGKQATGMEMPNPSIAELETGVRSHSVQLTKLNTELTSAFSQVTREMGELRKSTASTSTTLTSLASQSFNSQRLSPTQPPLLILRLRPLLRSPCGNPWTPGGNRTCNLPSPTPGSSISVGVSWGSASCSSSSSPPSFGLTGPRWP